MKIKVNACLNQWSYSKESGLTIIRINIIILY